MNTIRRSISVLLLLCFALLAGCGGSKPQTPAPAPANPARPVAEQPVTPATVKVGNVSSLLFAPLYVALEKGYFAEQKLTVQLESIQAGQDAMVFLADGQLDFVLAGYSADLFNAVGRGLDLKVIAPMGIQPQQGDPSPLVVRADLAKSGAAKSIKDLKGKKIATADGAGATGSFLVARRLAQAGLTLADVELVNLGLPAMEAALANKAVDAALMAEPYSTKAITGGAGVAIDKAVLAGTSASGLLTNGKLLQEKHDVVNRFVLALMKAAREIQGEKFKSDEHIKIFEKYTRLKPELLREVTPYDFDPYFNAAIPYKDLASLQEIMSQAGILKLQTPVNVSKVIDGSAASAAAKMLGRK